MTRGARYFADINYTLLLDVARNYKLHTYYALVYRTRKAIKEPKLQDGFSTMRENYWEAKKTKIRLLIVNHHRLEAKRNTNPPTNLASTH